MQPKLRISVDILQVISPVFKICVFIAATLTDITFQNLSKLTVFRERSSSKTVRFSEQIMSADKLLA